MAKDDAALRRLGGGRWETRDGRFAIEPQSGTWVIVDSETTDELGLPLVRGPFPSLTAAREAIASARTGAPAASPLAGRLEQARAAAPEKAADRRGARKAVPPAPGPPEPKWLTELGPADRRRVKDLIGRLEQAGIDGAERVARDEVAHDRPAIVRSVLTRRLRAISDAAGGTEGRAAVRAAVAALLAGSERGVGVRWRLVDGDGREIGDLDLPG